MLIAWVVLNLLLYDGSGVKEKIKKYFPHDRLLGMENDKLDSFLLYSTEGRY